MSHPRNSRAPKRKLLAACTALLVASGTLLALAPPASAAIVPGDAAALAAALDGPGTNITAASYVDIANAGQNGVGNSTLSSFPTNGSTFAIMTSGLAASADDPNANVPTLVAEATTPPPTWAAGMSAATPTSTSLSSRSTWMFRRPRTA